MDKNCVKNNKIYGLDYIRAICAIFIVIYHYSTRYFDSWLGYKYESNKIGLWWGCWAVSIFFILTAFLTIYNLHEKSGGGMKFIKKRAIRLYPAYWVGLIFTTLLILILNIEKFIGVVPTAINFSMLQGFINVKNVDGVYWTLTYEIQFYVLIAIFIGLKKTDKIELFNSIWLVCVIAYFIANHICGNHFAIKIIDKLIMPKYASPFIMGASLAYIVKNKKAILSYINAFAALCIHGYVHSGGSYGFLWAAVYVAFLLVAMILIVVSVKTGFKFKYDKPFLFVASISYPLYLIHQNMGYLIFDKVGITENSAVLIIGCLILSLGIAYLIHRFLELPMVSFLKKRFE